MDKLDRSMLYKVLTAPAYSESPQVFHEFHPSVKQIFNLQGLA